VHRIRSSVKGEPCDEGAPARGESWQFLAGRGLHYRVRRRIEVALGHRSWKWLAGRIEVPQSTLAGQVSKPKFSLSVVWKIARELNLELNDLMGLDETER
jgi:CI repressor-like protein